MFTGACKKSREIDWLLLASYFTVKSTEIFYSAGSNRMAIYLCMCKQIALSLVTCLSCRARLSQTVLLCSPKNFGGANVAASSVHTSVRSCPLEFSATICRISTKLQENFKYRWWMGGGWDYHLPVLVRSFFSIVTALQYRDQTWFSMHSRLPGPEGDVENRGKTPEGPGKR